jgi:hypothetical protein
MLFMTGWDTEVPIMKIRTRLAAALLLAVTAVSMAPAFAQQSESVFRVVPLESPKAESKGNRVMFGTGKDFEAQAAEMRKKLADPQLRKQLRAEQRAQAESSNPDLAEVLGLEASEAAALFDLMADQELQHLEVFFAKQDAQPTREAMHARMQQLANDETRKRQQIKEFLGVERFGRYLDYTDTVSERRQAVLFDDELAAADKLTADQKQRLMTILRGEREQLMSRSGRSMKTLLPTRMGGTREDFEAMMRKHQLESMEDSFRRMQQDSKSLLARLPEVLTASQLAVYTQMENDKLAGQRKYVQELRVNAGLSPEFDEGPPTAAPDQRTPVVGEVRVEVYVRVNEGEPVTVDLKTENGKAPAPFAVAEGLWVQVTPQLFTDGWTQIDYKFFEESDGRRRLLGGSLGSGGPPGSGGVPLGSGGSGTTVTGSKAYSVRTDARISPVQ